MTIKEKLDGMSNLEIFRSLERYGFECEGGKLEGCHEYIELMTRLLKEEIGFRHNVGWEVVEVPTDFFSQSNIDYRRNEMLGKYLNENDPVVRREVFCDWSIPANVVLNPAGIMKIVAEEMKANGEKN